MRSLTLLIILLMSSVVFAGCVSTEPPAPEARPSAVTGVQGKVLTSDLEPIEGAQVALMQDGATIGEAETAANGTYLITGVAAGTYKAQVVAFCCRATVRTVEVVADEVGRLDFQLTPFTTEDLQEPYAVKESWDGFISCSVTTPAVSVALCAVPGVFHESLEDPNEAFLLAFNVTKGVKTVIVAMEWESTGADALDDEFWLTVDDPGCGIDTCTYEYADVSGGSPVVVRIDGDDITDPEWGWDRVVDERTIRVRVFAGGDANVVYQQPFKIHYEVFYWQEAPEGHDILADA